jgi:hypothetical protein
LATIERWTIASWRLETVLPATVFPMKSRAYLAHALIASSKGGSVDRLWCAVHEDVDAAVEPVLDRQALVGDHVGEVREAVRAHALRELHGVGGL